MLCGGLAALWRVRRDLKLRLVSGQTWCLASIDYGMSELVSDDLVMGSELCPWSLTIALHVLLNSGVEAALMCLDSLRPPSYIRTLYIDSGRTEEHLVPRGTQIPYPVVVNLVEGLGVSQVVSEPLSSILGTRWHTTLIDGYTRRARSRSSLAEEPSKHKSNSEIVPEPEGVAPADAESMGTFVAGGSPIIVSLTPALPMESLSSFPALPSLLQGKVREHDICGYCLRCKQRIEFSGQQIVKLRDEIARMDRLFYMARQARRQEMARAAICTARDSVDRARAELESRPGCVSCVLVSTWHRSLKTVDTRSLSLGRNMSVSRFPNHADEPMYSQNRQSEPIREATPRPEQATHRVRPPEFYGEVEQEIKSELFLEQLNDIYDTLKYEDAIRVIFAVFRLLGMAKDWWLRTSEARALKDQPWTWNDF
ncbi:hypothetical protein M9H77_02793 [Catharanthus roseus]|uniref:Uncharacterized protein n=1 Tax=Catharanthus roseus TaxID=4058 RepID=A0ACC0C9L1_CATRO|nr:hypothetical protein M9H77_02793 [Catharanthus roseus]